MAPRRRALSLRARFDVLAAAGFKCSYCGKKAPSVYLQVDHVIPVAAGGTNDPENLVASCIDCNLGKSDRPVSPSHGVTYIECRPVPWQGMDTFRVLKAFILASSGSSRLILQIPSGRGTYDEMALGVLVSPGDLARRIAQAGAAHLFTVWYDA